MNKHLNVTSKPNFIAQAATAFVIGTMSMGAFAQAAGAGADYNRAERVRAAEIQRLEKYDKPVRPDPVGNAIVGGAVAGAINGVAAGARAVVTGTATGAAVNKARDR